MRRDVNVRFVDVDQVYARKVSCPDGKRILAGGAYWHAKGDPTPISPGGGKLQGIGPLSPTTWFASAIWQLPGALTTQLRVVVLCVPSAGLSGLVKRAATLENEPGTAASSVRRTLTCPSGTSAVVGGTWWILRGAGPVTNATLHLGGASPRPGQTTFYASGFEQAVNHALRVVLYCR